MIWLAFILLGLLYFIPTIEDEEIKDESIPLNSDGTEKCGLHKWSYGEDNELFCENCRIRAKHL